MGRDREGLPRKQINDTLMCVETDEHALRKAHAGYDKRDEEIRRYGTTTSTWSTAASGSSFVSTLTGAGWTWKISSRA